MNIILAGPKGTGKSTVGGIVAKRLEMPLIETDLHTESLARQRFGENLTCRDIVRQHGEPAFRKLEEEAVVAVAAGDWRIVATGGQTLLSPESRRILRPGNILVWLDADDGELWRRVAAGGIPSYLKSDDPKSEYAARISRLREAVSCFADFIVNTAGRDPDLIADELVDRLDTELSVRMQAANTFGEVVRLTTFGESHGPAVGAVLDGMPAGIAISEAGVQTELDRRRPGQSAVSTPRNEADRVEILSGVFEGKTTGSPIAFLIRNRDQRSGNYDYLRQSFRPGHADFSFWKKFGMRDHRGGGRSSGRETAARVAGGAAAKAVLKDRGIECLAYAEEIAGIQAHSIDYNTIEKNPVRCPDPDAAVLMEKAILAAAGEGDSVGGIIRVEINGLPPGLGDPVFGKLDARLSGAWMGLGAVKGVEIGAGFAVAGLRGSAMNDPIRRDGFVSNNAGGILGGISTGQTVTARLAVKPTPSISKRQKTVTTLGEDVDLSVGGRHDPCIVPRLIPVVESMAALVILDAILVQERLGHFEKAGNGQ